MPYTYVVNCPDGRRYYGVRYAKNADGKDLWSTYFTSSKEIHRMISIYGSDKFTAYVRKTFSTKDQAILWENKVLRRLNVRQNDAWVNKADNTGIPPMPGDSNPAKRSDVRQKISDRKTGKKRPDQSKRLRENHHMKNEESRKKMSDTRKARIQAGLIQTTKGNKRLDITGENHPRYGKKFEKLSAMNSVEYTCPHCGKNGKGPGMKRYHFNNCKGISKDDVR